MPCITASGNPPARQVHPRERFPRRRLRVLLRADATRKPDGKDRMKQTWFDDFAVLQVHMADPNFDQPATREIVWELPLAALNPRIFQSSADSHLVEDHT